ncbi:alpha/beta hydrolase [Nitrosomonas sp.]|uniref:alpha/beta hydrolase n=1 Tax=Nitrosomonas sp. TaxID=42353 RepID=UPI002083E4D2|nr:alpha/beta hydrolase [Nitrosomonas sp.]GJL74100.1 MAG: hypothetical protein NMNS02_02060 [Nitrosomonas sp.]
MHKFFIDGPAGRIETILAEPQTSPRGIAVIAHPHPLHGGTMDNKVVYTLFNSTLELGFIAVKFNFRGTGESEGIFDNGIGEVDDVAAVTQAVQNQFGGHSGKMPLLLAGFSFGGGVQLRAAERLNPQSLILIAPSIQNTNTPPLHEIREHTLIIHGDKDDIIPLNTMLDWAAPYSLPIVVIPGAEHFFHGNLTLLKRIIHKFHKT